MKKIIRRIKRLKVKPATPSSEVKQQDLALYWDPKMAAVLEEWGKGTTWDEIQYLLINCSGKVLDIACGTGKNIEMNSFIDGINLYGCDISDLLINKAKERGISESNLKVCDAKNTGYADAEFDYGYSIGSLEHFTEKGIEEFLVEAKRVTKKSSFHMIPVSRSGKNEGWLKTVQSFHNNSVNWWLNKFEATYSRVYVLDSSWNDDISFGKWFICK